MAGSRAALGLTMVAAPRLSAMTWIGRDGRKAGAQLLARATGGRDAALGAAAVAALLRGEDARLWIGAQVAADVTDFVGTAIARDDLPRSGRLGVLGLAGAATLAGVGTLLLLSNRGGRASAADGSQPDVTVPAAQTADGMEAVVIGGEGQDDAR
jgi:hypothetical protein